MFISVVEKKEEKKPYEECVRDAIGIQIQLGRTQKAREKRGEKRRRRRKMHELESHSPRLYFREGRVGNNKIRGGDPRKKGWRRDGEMLGEV